MKKKLFFQLFYRIDHILVSLAISKFFNLIYFNCHAFYCSLRFELLLSKTKISTTQEMRSPCEQPIWFWQSNEKPIQNSIQLSLGDRILSRLSTTTIKQNAGTIFRLETFIYLLPFPVTNDAIFYLHTYIYSSTAEFPPLVFSCSFSFEVKFWMADTIHN